jgi:ankyrin repeat protein
MSSFAETKTSSTPSPTSTPPSNPTFYRASFTRPPSIPLDLFLGSATATEEGIKRNPFAHHDSSNPDPKPNCKCEYSRHVLAECADCKKKSIPFWQIVDEEECIKQIQEEDASHQDKHMAMVHACGVTIEWLLAFTFDHNCWHRPTWWVNRHIIKEATRHNRRRYMDLDEMKQYARPAAVFMSHCWGAVWGDVVLAACHGARFGRVVWIDLFAVRQWPGNGADLDFRNVINKCQAFVVSVSPVDGLKEFMDSRPDRDAYLASEEGKAAKKRIPVFRLWCNVEIAAAYKKIPIVIKGGKATKEDDNNTYSYDTKCVGKLMDNLSLMIDVEASECEVVEDYAREMKVVRLLEGGSKGVNALVAGVVAGGHQSILYNILEIDAFVCNEPESFRALNIPLGCKGEAGMLAGQVLSAACGGGRDSIVQELLLKWNVKEDDDQNKEGETKRNDSMKKEKEKKRKWLIQLIDDSAVLWVASMSGHVGVVEKILEVVGINVNVVHSGGATPLYMASSNGHSATVKVLLKAGGNVNQAKTTTGISPLFIASSDGNVDTVKVLIKAGGNVNQAETTYGASPLYIASEKGNVDIVKVLLEAGGNVNQADTTNGASPLYMASCNGHVALVKVLIAAGGNVNQHRNKDATPLFIASMNGHIDMVRLLLQQPNIDIQKKTTRGDTAIGMATQKNHTEIVQLLTNAGATPPPPPFTRGNEDQIGLHTDKKCANGHGLIRFKTPHGGYFCDLCRQSVPTDTVMYGCNECDYDICISCEENILGERKQDDDKEEEEEEEEEDDDDMALAMALSMSMKHFRRKPKMIITMKLLIFVDRLRKALALHGNNVENACNYLLNSAMSNENSETKETKETNVAAFIRTNEDQQGWHTDKKCVNGHKLICFKIPQGSFHCDICRQGVPKDNVMYGCNECDYDICRNCEEKNLGETKKNDDEEDEDEEEEDEDEEEEDDDDGIDLAMAMSISMNRDN